MRRFRERKSMTVNPIIDRKIGLARDRNIDLILLIRSIFSSKDNKGEKPFLSIIVGYLKGDKLE